MLKGFRDTVRIEELRQLLRQSDVHVVLVWLLPRELTALYPILRERKNFSLVADDWWIQPHWFMREAEYVFFRKYEGIALRRGQTAFVTERQPPWIMNPAPHFGWYTNLAAALRLPALAISPAVNAWNFFRRRSEPVDPGRYIFSPFPLEAVNVPILDEPRQFDFANTGSSCGIWFMRDPFVSYHYTCANLYYDRQILTDAVARLEGRPFTFYDCRREPHDRQRLPYAEYQRMNQRARFLIATGGLQDASVPKFLEYACVGTPMIGRRLPFEYPWLDDCLVPVDIDDASLAPERLKPRLQTALDQYSGLREKCLGWRDRLLKLYDVHNLLDMVQGQIDGKPVPPGYLRGGTTATPEPEKADHRT